MASSSSPQTFYTLDDLRRWQQSGQELMPPARLAVIGDPIAHSRSPQMHNPALAARGIEGQYIRVLVPAGSVAEAFNLFASLDFQGVNCTIPHKFEALQAMDVVDDLAAKLGAVNTVAFRDGKLYGFNSDGPGFLLSAAEAFGTPVKNLRVLILGAGGGAGRAVAVQCALEGCRKIILINRSIAKIQDLKAECEALIEPANAPDIQVLPWEDAALCEALPGIDLIINATPIGMKEADPPLLPYTLITSSHLVYDMVYRAAGQTGFIAAAEAAGAKTCGGLALLLRQGAVSFRHWFGDPVPVTAMKAGLLA